jgi:hypothetical protein
MQRHAVLFFLVMVWLLAAQITLAAKPRNLISLADEGSKLTDAQAGKLEIALDKYN